MFKNFCPVKFCYIQDIQLPIFTTKLALIFTVVMLLHLAGCDTSTSSVRTSTDADPKVMSLRGNGANTDSRPVPVAFDKPEFDFGERFQNEQVTGKFELKNTSNKPIQLSDLHVTSSCGCSSVLLSDSRESLLPEENTTIEVTMNTGSDAGPLRRTVAAVTYKDSTDTEHAWELQFVGRVRAPLAFTPSTIKFSSSILGDAYDQILALSSPEGIPFKVTDIVCDASYVRGELVDSSFLDPLLRNRGDVFAIRVSLLAERPDPTPNATLTIHTSHPDRDRLAVPVLINNVAEIESRPEQIVLNEVRLGEAIHASFVVLVNTKESRHLSFSHSGELDVSLQSHSLVEGRRYRVDLDGIASNQPGQYSSEVAVVDKTSGTNLLSIPIRLKIKND